jgi:hypothetical protein
MRFRFALPIALVVSLGIALPVQAQGPKGDKKAETKKKKSKKDVEEAEEAPPPAPAIPTLSESLTGSAKTDYEAGRVLFQDGDYNGAALKFQKAYAASKDARLLWNVAAAEKNLRHYSKVISALEQYLAEGGDKLTEQDRSDAKQLVETVAAFVGNLEITVDQPDAEIAIDGEPAGKSPLSAPLRLDHGQHVVTVKKPGFEEYSARPNIGGGETETLKVVLKAILHQGRLRVVAGPGETITVNGKVVGKGSWEGTLESGQHTVSVSGRGKRTKEADVLVRDGEVTTSRMKLEADTPPPAQKDSGFWGSPWPYVIGGVVIAGGASVGAYFLFRPEDEKAPPPVGGSLNPGTVRLPIRF